MRRSARRRLSRGETHRGYSLLAAPVVRMGTATKFLGGIAVLIALVVLGRRLGGDSADDEEFETEIETEAPA